ncbi:MAG: LacI family transcriptional regulator [Lachnospiraceae bacterium]|nr:LacI family transcriptional regulator [Lachnospiraceae bacterium]
MASDKITINDVALALGVSKSTVSRAIAGNPRISQQTRDRVMAYIEEHNYHPNIAAKALASRKTYNIGLILPSDYHLMDMHFFQKCMLGVCEMASTLDFDVLVALTSDKDISQLERMVIQKKVEGIILTRTNVDDIAVEFLKNKGIPFITIGTTPDPNVMQIDNDHYGACRELTSILLSRGMKRVGIIGGSKSYMITQKRYNGFLDAFRERGEEPEADLIYMDMDSNLMVENAVENLVDAKAGCILCMDDNICNCTLNKLRRMHIKVPRDIKVASFYNSSILENNIPAITSLQFDARELGVLSCKMLLDKIDGKEVPNQTTLSYEVSMKESTKI